MWRRPALHPPHAPNGVNEGKPDDPSGGIPPREELVMAGRKARSAVFAPEDPAIPIRRARPSQMNRDARDKRGHDRKKMQTAV